jgi:hypothetical protein
MIVRQKRLPNNRSVIAFAKTILRPTECGMVFFCLPDVLLFTQSLSSDRYDGFNDNPY